MKLSEQTSASEPMPRHSAVGLSPGCWLENASFMLFIVSESPNHAMERTTDRCTLHP
jgi:hypothetical protein